jgi:hypothetical protein
MGVVLTKEGCSKLGAGWDIYYLKPWVDYDPKYTQYLMRHNFSEDQKLFGFTQEEVDEAKKPIPLSKCLCCQYYSEFTKRFLYKSG